LRIAIFTAQGIQLILLLFVLRPPTEPLKYLSAFKMQPYPLEEFLDREEEHDSEKGKRQKVLPSAKDPRTMKSFKAFEEQLQILGSATWRQTS